MPTAYSYLRFSSPQQASGDSIRRQTEARDKWLANHPAVQLDTTLRMTDLGRSAFKRTNWDTYALAQFVEAIKAGRVPVGSFLLVENLDRLSRGNEGDATELFLSIVNKGITIVQLSPVATEFTNPVNMFSLILAIVELSRGHSESVMKSERGRAAWVRKSREAATKLVSKATPRWIRYVESTGKLELNPAKAETVRRLFKMVIDGMGCVTIARTLNAEKVPVLGRADAWAARAVAHVISSRATIGEYIPSVTKKVKGEPVPGYFPAVVDEQTYYAAQAALKRRGDVGRGRRGTHTNLFAGLLTDARNGHSLSYRHQKGTSAAIVPVDNGRSGEPWVSFPVADFEAGILSGLFEVSASEIMDGPPGESTVASLTARLEEVTGLIGQWTERMDDPGIVALVAKKLGELSAKRDELAAELAEAQRAAASPLSAAWGEFKSLARVLSTDNSDDARLKVRAALRRAIAGVECLFVNVGRRNKRAVVLVRFVGTELVRAYFLKHELGVPVQVHSARHWFDTYPDLSTAEGRAEAERAVRGWKAWGISDRV